MPYPTTEQISERFVVGLALDHLWSETMGLPLDDKEKVLKRLVAVLERTSTPYAVIGGVAVQIYTQRPRATLDLDIALDSYQDLPRADLKEAGFVFEKEFPRTENWRDRLSALPKAGRVVVQFTAVDLAPMAVDHARREQVGDMELQLVTMPDLILLKLAAAEESTRRPSKKSQDITDVLSLLEEHPELNSIEILHRLRRIDLFLREHVSR